MKKELQNRPNGSIWPRTALFVLSLIAAVFFLLPTTVLAEPQYSIEVEPVNANGPAGTEQSFTATALYGNPAPEKCDVVFEILDGPHSGSSPARFENVGENPVTFSYTGSEVGTDTIRVTYTCMGTEQLPFRPPVEVYVDRFTDVTKEWLPPTTDEITAYVVPDCICIDLKRQKRVLCVDYDKMESWSKKAFKKKRKMAKRPLYRWQRKSTRVLKLVVRSTADLDVSTVDNSTCSLADPVYGHEITPKRSRLQDADRDGKEDLLLYYSIPRMVRSGILHGETTELVLNGKTQNSQEITARVPIRIVKNNDMKKRTKRW